MKEKSDIGFPIDRPAYLRVREGATVTTREILFGKIVGDFDEENRLLGLEILGPCFVTLGVDALPNYPAEMKTAQHAGV